MNRKVRKEEINDNEVEFDDDEHRVIEQYGQGDEEEENQANLEVWSVQGDWMLDFFFFCSFGFKMYHLMLVCVWYTLLGCLMFGCLVEDLACII